MSTTPIPSSLQQLKAEFDPWRQSKPTPQSCIPLGLRQQAAPLRGQYSDRDITRLLSITEGRLLKWAGVAPSPPPAAAAQVGDAITSLIATCEVNSINTFDYLVAIHFEVSRDAEAWLPWNYAETLATLEKPAA